jgi:hypothetical protein
MDDLSWNDLNSAEQRAIAVIAAGMPTRLCDALALFTLESAGLVAGSRLTPKAEQLRKAALLQTVTTAATSPRYPHIHGAALVALVSPAPRRR